MYLNIGVFEKRLCTVRFLVASTISNHTESKIRFHFAHLGQYFEFLHKFVFGFIWICGKPHGPTLVHHPLPRQVPGYPIVALYHVWNVVCSSQMEMDGN